jgi:hypothetical protein
MTMHDDPAMVPAVTDAAMAAMFDQRSRRGDSSGLRDLILAATTTAAQERRWYPQNRTLFPRPIAYAFIADLLALAVVALALTAAARFDRIRVQRRPSGSSCSIRDPRGLDCGRLMTSPCRDHLVRPGSHLARRPIDRTSRPRLRRTATNRKGADRLNGGPGAMPHRFSPPAPAAFIADLRDRSGVEIADG